MAVRRSLLAASGQIASATNTGLVRQRTGREAAAPGDHRGDAVRCDRSVFALPHGDHGSAIGFKSPIRVAVSIDVALSLLLREPAGRDSRRLGFDVDAGRVDVRMVGRRDHVRLGSQFGPTRHRDTPDRPAELSIHHLTDGRSVATAAHPIPRSSHER